MLEVKNIFRTDRNSFQCDEFFFHVNQKISHTHLDQATSQTIGHSVIELSTGYTRAQTCYNDVPRESPTIKQVTNKDYLIYFDQISGDHWVYLLENNQYLGHAKIHSISIQNRITQSYSNPFDPHVSFFLCEDESLYVLYISSDARDLSQPTTISFSSFLKFPRSITTKTLKGKEKIQALSFHPNFPMVFVGYNQGSVLVRIATSVFDNNDSSFAGLVIRKSAENAD